MFVLGFKLAAAQLRQKPFARAVVVLSVAAVLLMDGMAYLLFAGVSRSLAEVRASRFLTAYLDGSVPASKEAEVLSAVRKTPGVVSAQLVSKDAFLENFSRYFPQLSTEISALDAETIPRYVKVKAGPGGERQLESRLKGIAGVELVEANENRYGGLIGALLALRKLALVLLGGTSLALLCILLNHFKLGSAMQSQVRSTLSLLGARGGQVLLPFAVEGLAEGLAGGIVAAALLLAYGGAAQAQLGWTFAAMGHASQPGELAGVAGMLLAVGALSGMAGSLWAAVRARA